MKFLFYELSSILLFHSTHILLKKNSVKNSFENENERRKNLKIKKDEKKVKKLVKGKIFNRTAFLMTTDNKIF